MTAMKKTVRASRPRSTPLDEDFRGFPPGAFAFLRSLAANNERAWFESHRTEYEESLRAPMKALVEEMDARLAVLMPEITGTVKGSMFRIHRDVRFSKDKSPYKTNAACWFYHRDSRGNVGQDAVHGGAGLYFHLEPRACFAGGGVWMPPSPVLQRIRAALDVGHEEFESIVSAKAFRSTFGELSKEAVLTRMPRGFAPDHPAAEWLRFQSFTAGCALTQGEVTAATLPDRLESIYRTLVPFVRWLNKAMGFRAHSSR